MKREQSPASPLVQEIRHRSCRRSLECKRLAFCLKVATRPLFLYCNNCLLRLLTAEYETLQQQQAERDAHWRRNIAAVQMDADREIEGIEKDLEAAEARAEAAEAQVAILEVRKDNRNAKQAWENGFIAGKEAALASPVTDAAEPQKEQDLGLLGSTASGDAQEGAPRRHD